MKRFALILMMIAITIAAASCGSGQDPYADPDFGSTGFEGYEDADADSRFFGKDYTGGLENSRWEYYGDYTHQYITFYDDGSYVQEDYHIEDDGSETLQYNYTGTYESYYGDAAREIVEQNCGTDIPAGFSHTNGQLYAYHLVYENEAYVTCCGYIDGDTLEEAIPGRVDEYGIRSFTAVH